METVVLFDVGLRPILTVVVSVRVGPVTTTVEVEVDVERVEVISISSELELGPVKKRLKI